MTEHFSFEEMIHSDVARMRGINNTPPPAVRDALLFTAEGLERVRALTGGHKIVVLSGYRCPELNQAVHGSIMSQHMRGEAADIICPGYGSVHALAKLISNHGRALGVDQVIKEHNAKGAEWVHVSFTKVPRNVALTLTIKGLVPGIV